VVAGKAALWLPEVLMFGCRRDRIASSRAGMQLDLPGQMLAGEEPLAKSARAACRVAELLVPRPICQSWDG